MPVETGEVVRLKGGYAIVKTVRSSECESCKASGYCDSTGGGGMTVEVLNNLGAEPGDTVRIEISGQVFLAGSALVYLIPVIFLIGGMAVGRSLSAKYGWNSDTASLVFGMIAFAAVMFAVRFVANNTFGKNKALVPKIIGVVRKKKSGG